MLRLSVYNYYTFTDEQTPYSLRIQYLGVNINKKNFIWKIL